MSISEALVAEFKQEADNTRKYLQAVPEDRFGWKPHEKSMSLGRLAGHIAESPSWVRSMMQPELDFAAAGQDYKPFVAESAAELVKHFEEQVKGFEEALTGKDDAFMKETWTMRSGDNVLLSAPRHEAIRSTSINHIVHHRGQLSVYLRLIDVALPPIYGPTADDASF